MKTLNISVEIQGEQVLAGQITGNAPQDAVFTYDPGYLNAGFSPISISLPMQASPFTASETKNFFEGLLPEGFARRSVSSWLHADEDDYLTILEALGAECLGAIQVATVPWTAGSYEALSAADVKALATEGISRSTDMIVQAHLSLTGASGKVGLYYDEEKDLWFLPKGTAPSTHIIKQSHVRLDSIVTNEQLSLLTAQTLGLNVPESFIINTGEGKDGDVLFATRRYDRMILTNPEVIDELPVPLRLHQEDFAQALGIDAKEKYETNSQGYLRRIFELLRNYSADLIQDQIRLWDTLSFDFLIGNTDNHIKNLSLLYAPDLRTIRLAPVYDILSTCIYPESSRQMAIGIGGSFDIDHIGRAQFATAAEEAGFGKHMAMERLEKQANAFEEALKESARILTEQGFEKATEISERILQSGGFRNL